MATIIQFPIKDEAWSEVDQVLRDQLASTGASDSEVNDSLATVKAAFIEVQQVNRIDSTELTIPAELVMDLDEKAVRRIAEYVVQHIFDRVSPTIMNLKVQVVSEVAKRELAILRLKTGC